MTIDKNIRLPDDLLDRVKKRAKADGVSVDEAATQAVRIGLEEARWERLHASSNEQTEHAKMLSDPPHALVVDDEPAMTEWLKMVLEAEDWEVRTALIGTRCRAMFETWRPDVVVIDIMLPDMHGIDLLSRLKEIDRRPRGHHDYRSADD